MRAMMEAYDDTWAIKWPNTQVMKDWPIFQPSDIDEQNACYNGWLGDTYCSQVIVFLANGEIAWVCSNCPGYWHDAKIARGLYTLLADPSRTPPSSFILADSAFPYGKDVADRILSKPKENVATRETDTSKISLWAAITRQRQAAEWGMRALQGAFGRLDLRLTTDKSKRGLLLFVIFRLHNFRTRCVGLNQIKEVYFPNWQARQV
ncbi:hypothetical protein OC835_006348 [Tilletia horrida]|nr:hypothetical protein OC835_006348 [Tilletia horrida]